MRIHATSEANGNTLRAQYAHLLSGRGVTQEWVDARASTDEFWEHAWREGVGACIWHALQSLGLCVETSVREACVEQALRGQMAHALMLRAGAAELLRLFAGAGVDVVMLRGQSIADALYSPATLRPQTDIDLLLGEADLARAVGLLTDAGLEALPNHPLLFARGEVLLDLHIEPLGIERMTSWARLTPLRGDDFFRHAQRGRLLGAPAILPEARVTLPYLCFHAMKHSFEHLVWLWDIALLVRRVDADEAWHDVLAGIESYALQRPCFYALSYVHVHLDAPVPQGLLEKLRPDMDWRERQMFRRFMQHEQVPFLAERAFSRMQPDTWHRLGFWFETVWPRAEARRQVQADPRVRWGFVGKRLGQVVRAGLMLLRETLAGWRR